MEKTQQAQKQHHDGFPASTPPHDDVRSTHRNPLRYDPPGNQALCCIQDFLEQDDDAAAADSSLLSFSELVAYHAKVSELTDILKEDSPALSQDSTLTTPQDDTPSVSTELSWIWRMGSHLGNRVLLINNMRGPQGLNCKPSKVLDCRLFRSMASRSAMELEREKAREADDEMGASHVHGALAPRRVDALKPRKDMSIRKTKSYEYVDKSIGYIGPHEFADLNNLLLQCAHAVGTNSTKLAMQIACKVKQHTSPHGNGTERLAYYFVEALYARFSGTGWPLYSGHLNEQRPSTRQILKASINFMTSCPFSKASYFFTNKTLLNRAKGASTLHIIEHQSAGIQYPSLFKELAVQPGGPPKVQLDRIIVPHYSMLPTYREIFCEEQERTGRRLSRCAEHFGVPFRYTTWIGTLETIKWQDLVSPNRSSDEVLVIISAYLLRFVMDDILDPRLARVRNLKMISDLKPDLFIQGIVTGSYSTPYYLMRFKQALLHFASIFDVLDTFFQRECPDRVIFESEVLGKAILNVVACEGLLVSERVDTYTQWQALTAEMGLQQLPLDREILGKVRDLMKSWHKEYTVAEDRQYLLMGWKGRILYGMSTWTSLAALRRTPLPV